MRQFRDNREQTWDVTLNVSQVRAVRDILGVDLLKIIEANSDVFAKLDDPYTLCDVLYVLCRQQAAERGITDEQFGVGLGGDSLDAGAGALLEALIDFFPSPKRDFLRRILQMATARREAMAEAIQATPLQELLQPTSGVTSGSVPAAAESIPASTL